MSDVAAQLGTPSYADIVAAGQRLRGVAVRTHLLEAPSLNAEIGGRILIKAEVLQRTGSFKFRGAYNRISQLTPEEKRRGVVAFSSGNHAQGVSAAAEIIETPATVVMPASAPGIKVARCRGYGAEVVLHDGDRASMEARTLALAEEHGLTLVRPFEDDLVIAGQGTVGTEIADQVALLGPPPDAVLVPCGGGGLTAGIALALEARLPTSQLYTVEPDQFDDTARSLKAGERLAIAPGGRSICDALLVPRPGERTFAINRRRVAGGLTVSDTAVRQAMAALFGHFKIVVEPGGAVGLAALLSGVFDCGGKTVVVVATGGNVDPQVFAGALHAG